MILRLLVSLMYEEELHLREVEIVRRFEQLKDTKQRTGSAVMASKRDVEAFRDAYEIMIQEDKSLDKLFRKEFPDQDTHTIEQLYKLFKRRPR